MTAVEECRHRDRARVHHGVVGTIRPRLQLDGVEGIPARLDADTGRHFLLAELLERHPEGEWLRDRLDGEGAIEIPGLKYCAVGGRDCDAEVFRVRVSEFWNVGGQLAVRGRLIPSVQIVERLLEFVSGHGLRSS